MGNEGADKQLTCVDCGQEFVFSAGEQERFAELGFVNEPKRCPPCRAEKKKRYAGAPAPAPRDASGKPREMFTSKCSACGGEARVPFKPRNDRPVYCSACFNQQKNS